MLPYPQIEIGKAAENDACEYLQAQGLLLLEKNFRCYVGEIDLIMQDQADIVFVEVRKRSRIDYGHAVQSITQTKIKRLIKTATSYLQKKGWLHKKNSRFDIVTIQTINDKLELNWIKNAFQVDRS